MGTLTTVQCDGCDQQAKVTSALRCYVLDDGIVPLFAAIAWCQDCMKVVEADVLPVPEALETMEISDDAAAMERWRRWRNARQSPSRCLGCGSTRVKLPQDASFLRFRDDQDAAAFPHPGCGTFRVKSVGFAGGKATPGQFSPEGERL